MHLDRHCHSRHFLARFSATTTLPGTLLHGLVSTKPFTILGTVFTNFSAHATGMGMEIGVTQHKISTCLANFSTVQQQPNVRRCSMRATHAETMSHSLETNAVTVQAIVNALLHGLILVICMVRHRFAPLSMDFHKSDQEI